MNETVFYYIMYIGMLLGIALCIYQWNERTERNEKSYEDNNRRLLCFAVIAADIMLKDGYATIAELNVAKTYIANNFTEAEGKRILSMMKSFIQKNSKLNSGRFAELAATYYTYKERQNMAHIFFQIANFHGGICNTEWVTLCHVIQNMKLTKTDQINIISYYQHFTTGRDKANDAKDHDVFDSVSNNSVENKCLQILGLEPGATLANIKESYRKLVKQYHPDRLPQNLSETERENAVKKFRNVQKAYEKLLEIKG